MPANKSRSARFAPTNFRVGVVLAGFRARGLPPVPLQRANMVPRITSNLFMAPLQDEFAWPGICGPRNALCWSQQVKLESICSVVTSPLGGLIFYIQNAYLHPSMCGSYALLLGTHALLCDFSLGLPFLLLDAPLVAGSGPGVPATTGDCNHWLLG